MSLAQVMAFTLTSDPGTLIKREMRFAKYLADSEQKGKKTENIAPPLIMAACTRLHPENINLICEEK